MSKFIYIFMILINTVVSIKSQSVIKSTCADHWSQVLKTGKYSDVNFVLKNGETIKGHKWIFSLYSPIFNDMFYGNNIEEGDIVINEIEPDVFKILATFMYTSDVNLNSVYQAISVFEAGKLYGIENLETFTGEYINSNIDANNVFDIIDFSELYNKTFTKMLCRNFIRVETKSVLNAQNSMDYSVEKLEMICDEDKLNVTEIELYMFVEKWSRNRAKISGSVSTVRNLLKNVIENIRFLSMSTSDFISSLPWSRLLTEEEKRFILINLIQPGSAPVPHGFCDVVKPRSPGDMINDFSSRSTGISVNWRKRNISHTKLGTQIFSQDFYFNKHPFKFSFLLTPSDVGTYLWCGSKNETHGNNWNIKVSFKIQLLRKNGPPAYLPELTKTFNNTGGNGWGGLLLKRSDFNEGGYIEDDSVLLQLDLKLAE